MQSGGFLGRLLKPLLKTGLSLMKNLRKPWGKNVLIPLGLTAASAADTGVHKKILRLRVRTLIISNEQIDDIMKIVKSQEDSGSFIKFVKETCKNEAKKQKGGFLSMLLGALGTILTDEGIKAKLSGRGVRTSERTIRASQDLECCLIL